MYAHAMTADPARISVTAKLSAYYRKFSDIAFAAEAAALIGADEAFAKIVRDHALEPESSRSTLRCSRRGTKASPS